MWAFDSVSTYETNDSYNMAYDMQSSQWDFEFCDENNENYNGNEKDIATVIMNLDEYHAQTYETAVGYQTVNNNEQQQWQSVSDQLPQRVTMYDSLDNNCMHSNNENYLLPTILDIEKEFCKANASIVKKRAGRPRGAKVKRSKTEPKLSRIWEFIRDLLLDSQYCPTYICWENYEEGRFRFVQSDKVAKLWGKFKRNERMNYEKFSRAMRYYYKTGVLLPVQGKRLVYKFGPKATGWHTNNPNFKYSF